MQFVRVGGGYTPAGEASVMGPQQKAHLMASFQGPSQSAVENADRVQQQAVNEQAHWFAQAEKAQAREEGVVAAQQKRTDELQALEQDYRDQVAALGKNHLDSNRWWAQKTTGDKIATGILAFLGGLGAMGTGGPNLAWEAIKRDMDADIDAQKFDFATQMDQAKGTQNAFALAMQRYGSEDAATAAARAAALDFAQAKLGQLQGQWKGVEAQNAAADLLGRIDSEREKTIASGFRYVPATQQASRYVMQVRGQMLPGTVSEADAQKYALEHGVKPSEEIDKITVKGGVDAATERAKGSNEREKRTDEETRAIASQLQQAGVPAARQAAEKALAALNKSEGGFAEGVLRESYPTATKALSSQDANAREQAYANFSNAAIKAMMGNATEPEVGRAKEALGSAKDPAARKRAIADALESLAEIEKNIKAGASPEAQAAFDERRENAASGKRLVPASVSKGWK